MKDKSLKWYKAKIDSVRSLYIRQRDTDWKGQVKCFTCERILEWKECEAGHFHLRQHDFTSELAGDERNLQVQCSGCNNFMRGRPQLFALNLKAISKSSVILFSSNPPSFFIKFVL